MMLLSTPPKCWGYRLELPRPVYLLLGIEPMASHKQARVLLTAVYSQPSEMFLVNFLVDACGVRMCVTGPLMFRVPCSFAGGICE